MGDFWNTEVNDAAGPLTQEDFNDFCFVIESQGGNLPFTEFGISAGMRRLEREIAVALDPEQPDTQTGADE